MLIRGSVEFIEPARGQEELGFLFFRRYPLPGSNLIDIQLSNKHVIDVVALLAVIDVLALVNYLPHSCDVIESLQSDPEAFGARFAI